MMVKVVMSEGDYAWVFCWNGQMKGHDRWGFDGITSMLDWARSWRDATFTSLLVWLFHLSNTSHMYMYHQAPPRPTDPHCHSRLTLSVLQR